MWTGLLSLMVSFLQQSFGVSHSVSIRGLQEDTVDDRNLAFPITRNAPYAVIPMF